VERSRYGVFSIIAVPRREWRPIWLAFLYNWNCVVTSNQCDCVAAEVNIMAKGNNAQGRDKKKAKTASKKPAKKAVAPKKA
jgi:hypothetical protein